MIRMRIITLFLIFALLFSGLNLVFDHSGVTTPASGKIIYVGSSSTYKTIQEAVDKASAGDTIIVENGTYNENVTIYKPNINLIGNSSVDCNITHHYAGANINDHAAAINVTANGVKITSFNISVTGSFTFGIYLKSTSSNCTVKDNNINTTGERGYGIFMDNSPDNEIDNNKITTKGADAYGINFADKSNRNRITGNTISAANLHGHGIYLGLSHYNNITGNTIEINSIDSYGIILSQARRNNILDNTINTHVMNNDAIYIDPNSNYNNIINNTINTTGSSNRGIKLYLCSYNNITDNHIQTLDESAIGIDMDQCKNNNLERNTIRTGYSSVHGISLRQSTNNNLTDNNVYTNKSSAYGIYLFDSSNNNNLTINYVNTSETGGHGIFINGSSGNVLKSNSVNTSGTKGSGIYLHNSNGNDLTTNNINTTNTSAFAIHLEDSTLNNLTGNTLYTSGASAYGIYVNQSSKNCDFVGNTINSTGTYTYGIYLDQSSGNNLYDNIIDMLGHNLSAIFLDRSNVNNVVNNTITTLDSYSNGIYMEQSSNNNVTINKINTSGLLSIAICMLDTSTNNNLTGNRLNTSGNQGFGIYLSEESENNTILNNTIYTNNVMANGILNSGKSNYTEIVGNTVKTKHGMGIYIWESSNVNLTENDIYILKDSGWGLSIIQSPDCIIENCMIVSNTNTYGMYFTGLGAGTSMNATVINSSIEVKNGIDILARTYANVTLINSSFETVNNTITGGGLIKVKNFLHIRAYYEDAVTPIEGADVNVTDNNKTYYASTGYGGTNSDTNAYGRVEYILVTDRWYVYRDLSTENITNVSVKKTLDTTWEEEKDYVFMDKSQTLTFIATNIVKPKQPTGLNVSRVPDTNTINISWDFSTESDIANYAVYSNRTGQWEVIANVSYQNNWTWDENLTDNKWYYYRIQVWDGTGLNSTLTSIVPFYLDNITKPAVPTGLSIAPVPGGDAFNISWTLNSDLTVNYEVFWKNQINNWVSIATIPDPKNWTVWSDPSLTNGTTYYFKIRALDSVPKYSDFTLEKSAVHRDYIAPAAPTNLKATAASEHSITLTWLASSDADVVGYRIYINRSGAGSGGPYDYVDEVTTLTYLCTGLLENVTYYFVVLAFDEANNPSANSGEAFVSTGAVPPAKPTLNALPQYTNNPDLDVTGTAEPNIFVLVYVNSNLEATGSSNSLGEFTIAITLVEGTNEIKARARDNAMVLGPYSDPRSAILDTEEPNADAGNDIDIEVGDTANFDASDSDDNYDLANFTWEFNYGSRSVVTLYGETNQYKFDIKGDYKVTLTVTDLAGNTDTDTLWVNVTKPAPPPPPPDTTPPVIDDITGNISHDRLKSLEIFVVAHDDENISEVKIYFNDEIVGTLMTKISDDNFTHNLDVTKLAELTGYAGDNKILYKIMVWDTNNNTVAAPTSGYFVITLFEIERPRVDDTYPEPDKTNVPVNTTATLTFSIAMETKTVEDALSISPAVDYKLSWSAGDTVVTLTFNNDLSYDKTYTVTLGGGKATTSGTLKNAPFSFKFTTELPTITITSHTTDIEVEAGEMITVSGSSAGFSEGVLVKVEIEDKSVTTSIEADGTWSVKVKAPETEGSYTLKTSAGSSSHTVNITVKEKDVPIVNGDGDGDGKTDGEKEAAGDNNLLFAIIAIIVIIIVLVVVVLMMKKKKKPVEEPIVEESEEQEEIVDEAEGEAEPGEEAEGEEEEKEAVDELQEQL